MKKILGFTITLCLALLTASCKKEAEEPGPQEPEFEQSVEQQEPRWLVVLHPEWAFGPKYERIDVTDWEVNEDVVVLGYFYYPWQGEDTIEFRFENGYLWVNGRRVGVNLGIGELEASDVENPEEIITAHVPWPDIPELKRFPNLTTVKLTLIYWRHKFPKQELRQVLARMPEGVDVYVRTFAYGDFLFSDPNIPDCILGMVSRIPNLKGLLVHSDRLTDLGMRHLRRCKNLRSLNLTARRVTSCGLKYLADLAELREIKLWVNLTNRGLRHLAGLTNLRSLNLYGMRRITDAGLRHLSGLGNLRELDLSYSHIKGPGLKHLSGLGNLRVLRLSDTPIEGYGLQYLSTLPNLRVLCLGSTKINDAGLKYLEGLSQLEELWLSRSEVTDAGLVYLKRFNNLRVLGICSYKISPDAFYKLQEALPDCKIY